MPDLTPYDRYILARALVGLSWDGVLMPELPPSAIAVGRRLYIQTSWRSSVSQPKYMQITGGNSSGLYSADDLPHHKVALFCEGEFDVLIARQEVGKWIYSVSVGSASNRLSVHWQSELSAVHEWLAVVITISGVFSG